MRITFSWIRRILLEPLFIHEASLCDSVLLELKIEFRQSLFMMFEMSQDSTTFPTLYKSHAGFLRAMENHKACESRIRVPFEKQEVETDAGKTYIRLTGPVTGEPVFLWHGLGSHGGTWYHQINELAKEYRLFVPDIIGGMGRARQRDWDMKVRHTDAGLRK